LPFLFLIIAIFPDAFMRSQLKINITNKFQDVNS
jgi:hypothetical protein